MRYKTCLRQLAHDEKDILQRDVVNLKLLPRRDVNRIAAVACGNLSDGTQLERSESASSRSNAHHIGAVFALLIATEGNAARFQGCGIDLASLESCDLGIRLFEFRGEIFWNLVEHSNVLCNKQSQLL